jgi:hypothetical protein
MGFRDFFTMVPMWVMESCPRQDINMIAILVGGGWQFRVGGGKQQQQPCRKDRGGRKRAPTCLRQTTTHVDANAKD